MADFATRIDHAADARSYVGVVGPLVLVALSAIGYTAGVPLKVLGIAWVAFFAMALAVPLGLRAERRTHARNLVWGYGLASGAMVASAAVFLLPEAIEQHAQFGGIGVAVGLLLGFAAHTVGHRLSHLDLPGDRTTAELAAHSLAGGAMVGVLYAAMPDLGPLLGLAIFSHKAPAGYAAARRLNRSGKSTVSLLIPAACVGIAAILAGLLDPPSAAAVNAVVFGFAAGVFLHVAMDFLPRCETGGEIYEVASLSDDAHALLDRLRLHAVASTVLGSIAVFGAWLAV